MRNILQCHCYMLTFTHTFSLSLRNEIDERESPEFIGKTETPMQREHFNFAFSIGIFSFSYSVMVKHSSSFHSVRTVDQLFTNILRERFVKDRQWSNVRCYETLFKRLIVWFMVNFANSESKWSFVLKIKKKKFNKEWRFLVLDKTIRWFISTFWIQNLIKQKNVVFKLMWKVYEK